jgi:hypothetical protein
MEKNITKVRLVKLSVFYHLDRGVAIIDSNLKQDFIRVHPVNDKPIFIGESYIIKEVVNMAKLYDKKFDYMQQFEEYKPCEN